MKLDRFSSYTIRLPNRNLTARNRVVVPPMASATAHTDGSASEKTLEHYRRLARSGAGLVFVEYSFVHASGRSEPNQLGADQDGHLRGLAAIAAAIQAEGALAGLQLVHAGGKTSSSLTGGPLLGASAIAVPVKDQELERPRALPLAEISALREWYVQAVGRARHAGFDVAELHAAHGYGLNQWLSPLTNQRTDRYGGDLAARARLLFEILALARHESGGEIALAVRLPGQDHAPGGLTTGDARRLAQRLAQSGLADLLDISSGIGGWRRPEGRRGEGYLVDDAALVRSATRLPVIGVGGIESGKFIDQALSRGAFDFAAVGRAILKDPEAWQALNMSPKATTDARSETI